MNKLLKQSKCTEYKTIAVNTAGRIQDWEKAKIQRLIKKGEYESINFWFIIGLNKTSGKNSGTGAEHGIYFFSQ